MFKTQDETSQDISTVWMESLAGGNFGESTRFEHLAKESLVN